jgi:hypothetical protein
MPRPTALSPFALLAAIAVAGGTCTEPTGPDRRVVDGVVYERRPSVLVFAGGEAVRVTSPDTVTAGVPFPVTIVTYGGGCILLGETAVAVSGLFAELRPFEWFVTPSANVACTDDIRRLEHTATVTFPTAGRATLRVLGRQLPDEGTVSVERAIVVK